MENRDYLDHLLRVAETSKKKQHLHTVLNELVDQKEYNKKSDSLKLGKISLKIFWLLEILSVGIILMSFFLLLK